MNSAITIDLDSVRHYHAIHGLRDPGKYDPPLDVGFARFLDLCRDLRVRSTIFVVAKDLTRPDFAALVSRASSEGHEIASHSYAHAYDLCMRPLAEIEADLARSIDEIARVVDKRPLGFRAPGYNVSAALFSALERLGFVYDSSIMRSPPYFLLRALVIALRRRRTRSFVGDPRRWMRAPPSRVREIPITTWFGWPWIGTSLAFAPEKLARASVAGASLWASPCVLGLHAIDFCDRRDGFEDDLVDVRPDLRVSWQTKLRRLGAVVEALSTRCSPLLEIALRSSRSDS